MDRRHISVDAASNRFAAADDNEVSIVALPASPHQTTA
jgi:hypothetical protein